MITVEQALGIIRQNIPPAQFEKVSLIESLGRVLAEDVLADVDMPPFNKSLMDGYAVRSQDIQSPPVELEVLEIVAAGCQAAKQVKPGKAIRIMTGAPIPDGADAVIMDEQTQYEPSTRTVRCLSVIGPNANISFRSADIVSGDRVAARGTKITPQVVGLLAAVGKDKIQVYKYPSVSVAVTGNELVEITKKPVGAEIRCSNAYALLSQLVKVGVTADFLGIIKDDMDVMSGRIAAGLKSDMLILTGGVSQGDYDLVKDAFKRLFVKILFDRVSIKPGKPTVFGVGPQGQMIFGLSGNPASAFVGVEVFVKEALSVFCNDVTIKSRKLKAILAGPIESASIRQQYLPARVLSDGRVEQIAGHGSADLISLSRAGAFIVVPADSPILPSGSSVDLMLL